MIPSLFSLFTFSVQRNHLGRRYPPRCRNGGRSGRHAGFIRDDLRIGNIGDDFLIAAVGQRCRVACAVIGEWANIEKLIVMPEVAVIGNVAIGSATAGIITIPDIVHQ